MNEAMWMFNFISNAFVKSVSALFPSSMNYSDNAFFSFFYFFLFLFKMCGWLLRQHEKKCLESNATVIWIPRFACYFLDS